jgi:hypothetical protein
MRIGKKGTAYLNRLDEPMVSEQDERIFDWLAEQYTKAGKIIGNSKKTLRHIASFREKSGIDGNHLALLCESFLLDEAEQDFSFKLEYVFFKPRPYHEKFVLEESKLYNHYLKNKKKFDNKFNTVKAWS